MSKAFTLTAEEAQVGGATAWTYNGTVPGPQLTVVQGDYVRVTLIAGAAALLFTLPLRDVELKQGRPGMMPGSCGA